jgi:hypothetical protein
MPPEQAMVLGCEEKSQTHALDRTQPILPLSPGRSKPGSARLQVYLTWKRNLCFSAKISWAEPELNRRHMDFQNAGNRIFRLRNAD